MRDIQGSEATSRGFCRARDLARDRARREREQSAWMAPLGDAPPSSAPSTSACAAANYALLVTSGFEAVARDALPAELHVELPPPPELQRGFSAGPAGGVAPLLRLQSIDEPG